MSKQKLLFWFSALILSVLLVGCGNNSGNENTENANVDAREQITINIFQGKVEFRDQFIELAKQYEEENPNVKINFAAVGGGTDYFTSLRSKFSSGDEPEIFSLGGPSELVDYKQYLADVSDTQAASLALEGTLEGISDENGVYGLPFNLEGYGLIYNKRVFEEAGVKPDEILTYEDLKTAVQTVDEQKEELGIDAVFALAGSELWVTGNHLSNVFIAPEFDHDVTKAFESNTLTFEKSEELQKMVDLQNDYAVQPSLSVDYSQQVERYFSLERVAMIQQGNWIFPSVYQMDPEFAENGIGILPIPMEGYEGHLPVGVPNYWVVNKNKDDEVVQASKDFLDWLYTSEVGKETVLTELNFIPAYEGFDESKIADPLSREIYEYSTKGNTVGWVFMGYPNPWGDILGANIQKYIDGQSSWEEVVENSVNEWENMRR
ncbi:sugar ABC transporter substrate-binding protein [Anaerobacillus alkalidiazotrophicus]|uniref:Sugar ABC transporter substrate-binding protein n=1 Tax=Anaerobacillus alkalidiazotrophicus TaxID=472963 RepID=A0A1S2MFF8_9BACI|nr:ABC transporter substrate-binding protein [Anaerobacillus alkalidiazotrophicus]OIJ22425.1 sugar ABC transporter substrate-binding protein [Anaerobacillus alkalidiazotrophicus]